MRGVEAVQEKQQLSPLMRFYQAQRTMNRMWHAMRYARLNLLDLKGRPFVSSRQRAEAHELIRSTRMLYLEAQNEFFECHKALMDIIFK
ncbi:MAG: hypothetical protein K2Y39_22415 [Candidatus Obscuribacterales bacterium]|nr:hypothetical protein [Candidatus Obscuribacterales bacterium]